MIEVLKAVSNRRSLQLLLTTAVQNPKPFQKILAWFKKAYN